MSKELKETGSGNDASRLLTELNGGTPLPTPPSATRRLLLLLGYGGLVAVNVASGMGAFGPDNAVVSNAYPTAITPSGYAFAIWGIIFMLEGAGVAYLVLPSDMGSVRAITLEAVHAPWLGMWMCQNLWQLVFSRTPLVPNPSYIAQGQIFVPCCILLLGAWGCGVAACHRLTRGGVQSHTAGVLVALPSAINAGWLSAASCIGIALVMQSIAGGPEALNGTGAPHILAAAATTGAVVALYKCGAGYVGLGYAGAVAWALRAIYVNTSNSVTTDDIRYLALGGACVIGVAAAGAVLRKVQLYMGWGVA